MELKTRKLKASTRMKTKKTKKLTSFIDLFDMKAWKPYYFQENENRELCDAPDGEVNSLLCKCL